MKERKQGLTKRKRKDYLFCYMMLIFPIYTIVQYFVVNFDSILIAFTVRSVDGTEIFSLLNWKRLFQELGDFDSTIWNALINTIKYFVLHVAKIPLSFIISYALFKKIKGYKFFRTVFFLPSMITPVILIFIVKDLLKVGGPLWQLMNDWFGYDMPNLLANYDTATNVILIYVLWTGFGTSMLLFIGTMNRIPDSILEAGQLDGCNRFQEFIHIIVPMSWETISTSLMLTVMTIFTASGPILYFTGGDYNTNTLAYWIFDQVRDGTYNYPTTVGLFFSILTIPVILLTNYMMERGNKHAEF